MVKLLICGGGNGAHVFAGIASSQPDTEARVLSLYADEAERWSNAMKDNDFVVTLHATGAESKTIKSKPSMVTKDAAQAATGVDIIVFTVPAFAHAQYLEALKPHVKPGLVLVGLPGQAGFEFGVRGSWGDLAKQCTLLSFESLPWACRMTEFGKTAEVLGTKGTLAGAIHVGSPAPKQDGTAMLQQCLGPLPKLTATGHLLGITLMATNGYLHPSIMYGFWSKWNGKPLDSNPLFYNGLDEPSAAVLSGVSDEIVATAKAIMEARKQVDLSAVTHIYQWYLKCYGEDITDKTNLYTCIQTNRAYQGLTHPTEQTPEGKFMPNFKFRYLFEDIPCGLLVCKSIAEMAKVPTPKMDEVLAWAQGVMGKEYVVDGQLKGKDIKDTRTAHRFNLTTLDAVLGLD